MDAGLIEKLISDNLQKKPSLNALVNEYFEAENKQKDISLATFSRFIRQNNLASVKAAPTRFTGRDYPHAEVKSKALLFEYFKRLKVDEYFVYIDETTFSGRNYCKSRWIAS